MPPPCLLAPLPLLDPYTDQYLPFVPHTQNVTHHPTPRKPYPHTYVACLFRSPAQKKLLVPFKLCCVVNLRAGDVAHRQGKVVEMARPTFHATRVHIRVQGVFTRYSGRYSRRLRSPTREILSPCALTTTAPYLSSDCFARQRVTFEWRYGVQLQSCCRKSCMPAAD